MSALKEHWPQIVVLVSLLVGGGAWVAAADNYHQKSMKNEEATSRAVEAITELKYQNQIQNLTIRLLCQEEAHKSESICRAIAAQDKAKAVAAERAAAQ